MKKHLLTGLMILFAVTALGCGGRNAQFGVVDMKELETKAPVVQTVKEEVNKKSQELREELEKEMAGKSKEEQEKVIEDKSAQMQLIQSEAQNKLKASLDTALNTVAKEKGLSAILIKEAVPEGGINVTDAVIEKMK